jgi:hypothetical protein
VGSVELKKSKGKLSLLVRLAGTPSQLISLLPVVLPGAVFNGSPRRRRNSSSADVISPEAFTIVDCICGAGLS